MNYHTFISPPGFHICSLSIPVKHNSLIVRSRCKCSYERRTGICVGARFAQIYPCYRSGWSTMSRNRKFFDPRIQFPYTYCIIIARRNYEVSHRCNEIMDIVTGGKLLGNVFKKFFIGIGTHFKDIPDTPATQSS